MAPVGGTGRPNSGQQPDMGTKLEYLSYSDATGHEYTETHTSPIALSIREDELQAAGYTIIH